MILNIINGNFGLVKSWQKNPKPIGAIVLFVPFGLTPSHILKPNWNDQKRVARLDNQLYIRKETYKISYRMKWCVCECKPLLFSLEHMRVNWLRDHSSWAKVEFEWRLKVFPSTSNILFLISPHQGTLSYFKILKFTWYMLSITNEVNLLISVAYVLYAIQTMFFQHYVCIWDALK